MGFISIIQKDSRESMKDSGDRGDDIQQRGQARSQPTLICSTNSTKSFWGLQSIKQLLRHFIHNHKCKPQEQKSGDHQTQDTFSGKFITSPSTTSGGDCGLVVDWHYCPQSCASSVAKNKINASLQMNFKPEGKSQGAEAIIRKLQEPWCSRPRGPLGWRLLDVLALDEWFRSAY